MSDFNEIEDQEPVGKDNESKEEKFKRLATFRVNKAIKCLDQIGNLSNTGAYSYTQEMAEKMFETLQEKLDELKSKFEPKKKKSESDFSF